MSAFDFLRRCGLSNSETPYYGNFCDHTVPIKFTKFCKSYSCTTPTKGKPIVIVTNTMVCPKCNSSDFTFKKIAVKNDECRI